MQAKEIDVEELDKLFDDGEEDVTQYFDLSNVKRPNREKERVNVDFPVWMIKCLDNEASRLGVTRQSVIKFWLAEKLEQASTANLKSTDLP